MNQHSPTTSPSLTPFITIWSGQAVSLLGSRIVQFALVWWLTQRTGSATVLATATLAALLPQVLISPLAGTYVDRASRRRVMILADSFVALGALILVYLFWAGRIQIWHIYAIMFARSVGESFHWPAMQASTTLMVPEKHLTRVAGFNQTLQGLLNIAGPPLGALLLGLLTMHNVLLIDVGTALFAIIPLFFIYVPQPPRKVAAGTQNQSSSFWAEMLAGLRYLQSWPGLIMIVFMAMAINFVMIPAFSLLPLLVTTHFNGGAIELGWLEASWGIGVVGGGLLLGIWGGFKKRMYTSLLGLIGMGLGVLGLGLTPATSLWLAIGSLFIAGLMNSVTNGPFFALLQAKVDPEMQGRVFTVIGSATSAVAPLSLTVAGPLADAIGLQIWYVVGGAVCLVLGSGAFFVPALINIEADRHIQPAESFAVAPTSEAIPQTIE